MPMSELDKEDFRDVFKAVTALVAFRELLVRYGPCAPGGLSSVAAANGMANELAALVFTGKAPAP